MSVSTDTKFADWVRQTGVGTIAERLRELGPSCSVTETAVYQWVRGDHEPRPAKIRGLVKISEGEITFDDVNHHLEIARASKIHRQEGFTK